MAVIMAGGIGAYWGHSILFGAGVDVSYGWSFKGNVGAEIVT